MRRIRGGLGGGAQGCAFFFFSLAPLEEKNVFLQSRNEKLQNILAPCLPPTHLRTPPPHTTTLHHSLQSHHSSRALLLPL